MTRNPGLGVSGGRSISGIYVIAAGVEAALGYGYVRVSRSGFFEGRGYLRFFLYALGFSLPIVLFYTGNNVLREVAGSQFWFMVTAAVFASWPILRERYRQGKYKEDAENVENYSRGLVLAIAILAGLFGPILLILWLFSTYS